MITMKRVYGSYDKELLKKLFTENKLDSVAYINSLKSQIIRSLKINISNLKSDSEIILTAGNIIEMLYYDEELNDLFYCIGQVEDIHTHESFCLDCSSNYNNMIKSIIVGNIRYLNILDKDNPLLKNGGLYISYKELHDIVTFDESKVCPVCGQLKREPRETIVVDGLARILERDEVHRLYHFSKGCTCKCGILDKDKNISADTETNKGTQTDPITSESGTQTDNSGTEVKPDENTSGNQSTGTSTEASTQTETTPSNPSVETGTQTGEVTNKPEEPSQPSTGNESKPDESQNKPNTETSTVGTGTQETPSANDTTSQNSNTETPSTNDNISTGTVNTGTQDTPSESGNSGTQPATPVEPFSPSHENGHEENSGVQTEPNNQPQAGSDNKEEAPENTHTSEGESSHVEENSNTGKDIAEEQPPSPKAEEDEAVPEAPKEGTGEVSPSNPENNGQPTVTPSENADTTPKEPISNEEAEHPSPSPDLTEGKENDRHEEPVEKAQEEPSVKPSLEKSEILEDIPPFRNEDKVEETPQESPDSNIRVINEPSVSPTPSPSGNNISTGSVNSETSSGSTTGDRLHAGTEGIEAVNGPSSILEDTPPFSNREESSTMTSSPESGTSSLDSDSGKQTSSDGDSENGLENGNERNESPSI